MMPNGVRLGLIGVGKHAVAYHVPAIAEHPDARLVAVCDPSPEAAGRIADEAGARPFGVVEAMLEAADLDGVIIASPHTLHHRHASLAIERGLHVLLEKPMVTQTTDALDLIRRAESAGVLLGVGFNRHLDPANLYARDAIRRGALGEIRLAVAMQLGYPTTGWYVTRALGGGGPLTGRGTHMADLICWYWDRRPERVTASTSGRLGEVEAGGTFIVDFADERQCTVTTASGGHRDVDRMTIYGTDGALEVLRPLGWQYRWDVRHYGRGGEPIDVPALPSGSTTTANFVEAILGRAELSGTALEGARATQIVEAAYESAATGHAVGLQELTLPGRVAEPSP